MHDCPRLNSTGHFLSFLDDAMLIFPIFRAVHYRCEVKTKGEGGGQLESRENLDSVQIKLYLTITAS